jgi:integrase
MAKRIWTIEAINQRLKETGIQLEQRGKKISLRATLPAKCGDGRRQDRIPLGLSALVPLELEMAEAKAWELAAQKAQGRFRWEDWVQREKIEGLTSGDWVERYRQHRVSRGMKPETWKDYAWITYKKLALDQVLNEASLLAVATKSPPNSWIRKQDCLNLQRLAEFAGLSVDLTPYKGNYSSRHCQRDLPTDEAIVTGREAFLTERSRIRAATYRWQYAYGLMACYGLRPHEVFFARVNPEPPHECRVSEGKTGPRTVVPFYPEWAVDWQLWDGADFQANGELYRRLGNKVCMAMLRYIDFPPYNLRHAYAIRGCVRFGTPTRIMASYMGHSHEEFVRTYTKFLSESEAMDVYLTLLGREDRPKPPS